MQVFPVSTVETAVHFTRLTTTAVRANRTTPEKTVKTVSCFSLSATFSVSAMAELGRQLGRFFSNFD